MPKYDTIAEDLMAKIHDGTYAENGRLPTTEQLCEIYGCSKITVRKALDVLEHRGLVARRRGSGTYVKATEPTSSPIGKGWSPSSQMGGFTIERAVLGEVVTSEVKDFSVVRPPEDIARVLHMEADEFAYHVVRLRFSDGVPLAVEYIYLPITLLPKMREKHVEGSLYRYIQEDLGLKIGSAHRTVRAVLPTPEEASWLGIEPGEPLLELAQVRYLDDGTPLECSTARHCGNYELHSINTR